jgi:nucleotide-binding universal stress UspA family protein
MRVTILHAYSLPPVGGAEFAYLPPSSIKDVTDVAETFVRDLAVPGEQTLAVLGSPASAIGEAAANLDAGLIVMAAGGKGLLRRTALGSTTDRVLHAGLRRTVLVLPPDGE